MNVFRVQKRDNKSVVFLVSVVTATFGDLVNHKPRYGRLVESRRHLASSRVCSG